MGEKMLLREMNRSSPKRPRTGESAFQHLPALALCCPLVLSRPLACLFPTTLSCPNLMDHLPSSVSWHHEVNTDRKEYPKIQMSLKEEANIRRKEKL